MSTRVVDRVDDWSQRSFTGGYHTLHEFADEEFSGVIRASGAELYMTRGTVVGARHGTIEDFEGSGTAYEAPAPGLVLLAMMQETNDEVQARYYSENTAISEVDSTLSDGGFTGYIELAENVLSGDYYIVYHAGESTSVGFVGQSGRLIHGDEAFETANDEVGIYQVRPADIEPVEIPAVDPPESGTGTSTETDDRDQEAVDDSSSDESAETSEQNEREDDTDAVEANASESAPPQEVTDESERDDSEETESASAETAREQTTETAGEQAEETRSDRRVESQTTGVEQRRDGQASESLPDQSSDRTVSVEEIDVETRAIPSIDPARTTDPGESTGNRGRTLARHSDQHRHSGQRRHSEDGQRNQAGHATGTQQTAKTDTTARTDTPTATETKSESTSTSATDGPAEPVETEPPEELQAQLQAREDEIEGLESELDRKTEEYENVRSKLETAQGERDELAREVERLETELERLETELGAATDAQQRMAGATALAQTDIFPRYDSKSDATLKKAHGGSHRREKVSENLRLEKNTQFDESVVSVNGQTYAEFLDSTLEYQFVEWIIGDLLFEIRETGNEKSLRDLYNALPVIDRADLSGTVDVVYTEDGQETRSQESFDIILRNRMGEPLIVANLNDSREGATESMMEQLVRSAERVGQTNDSFAGAFLVTRSFFEPAALETADDATKGGLFSRDKRKSYVNLSRKNGYHLCLVEARNRNFTLLVPEL